MSSVVLDTCVLYPAHLRDTLLRLADRSLYRPMWSDEILEELRRSLGRAGITTTSVDALIATMRSAFPDSIVTGYDDFIPRLTCDPKDRHVLAAAVRSSAASIVTFNVSDFPPASTQPFDIEVVHPDVFLLDQLALDPRGVTEEIVDQASANRRRPNTTQDLLAALARAGVPSFAGAVVRLLA